MNIHHTTKTTLLAFLGFMCLTTELEAKFNPLKYINPGKVFIGTILAALFRLHSKGSIPDFTEARVKRYEKADLYMKPICYIDDWIVGQLESSNLLKVTDKNHIKFSCKDAADAAGLFGTIESFAEPYADAIKNFVFISICFDILCYKGILFHKYAEKMSKLINKTLSLSKDYFHNHDEYYQ